jgi:hypothetical protein
MDKWSDSVTKWVDAYSWYFIFTFSSVELELTMGLIDNRNVPALGRIGDPDDILASVLIEDGKVSKSPC